MAQERTVMEREEIKLTEGMTGVVVYAEPLDKETGRHKWIVLIAKVTCYGGVCHIQRFASHDVDDNKGYAEIYPGGWGNSIGYKFYKATREESKMVASELHKRGLKYISVLKKVINVRKNYNY